MTRRALIVAGMHRSGTSAFAGTLIRLGAQGPATPMRPTGDNPRGYGESAAFYAFHERLLESAGTRWSAWTRFSQQWFGSPAAAPFAREFRQLLHEEFGSAPLFVAKDPRISRFVPFWLRHLQADNIVPAVIIPMRSPLDVARSLELRDGFGTRRSLLLWLRHLLDAEHDTRGNARSIVRYEDLLEDWQAVARRISTETGVEWPVDPSTADGDVTAFLSPELRHHSIPIEALDDRLPFVEWVRRTYRALESLTASQPRNAAESLAELDRVRSEFDAAASAFGSVVEEEEIYLRDLSRRSAEQEVEALHGELESERRELARVRAESIASDHHHRAEVAALQSELSLANAAGIANTERLQTLTDELARVRAESIASEQYHRAQVAALQSELSQARAAGIANTERLQALTDELAVSRARVDGLLASASWRVTAPLRSLGRILMRVPLSLFVA